MPSRKQYFRKNKSKVQRRPKTLNSTVPGEVLPTCKHALPLPISTRGIGFAVSYTYTFLSRFRHFEMPIYQLYRASLIQLQVQLFEASDSMYKHQIIPKDYNNMYISLKDRKFVSREPKNFKMITTIINNFGPFTNDGISYQPFLPDAECPNPFNVTIRNLRETVVALSSSDENTKEARWTFYQHNSIPGAKWEVDENTKDARLTNADYIMPSEYDLIDDYTKFVNSIMTISQEYFNHMGTLTYSGKGGACQLVSIKEHCISKIPSSEKVIAEKKTVFKHFPPTDSELMTYAFGSLNTDDMFLGIVGLYGEHCKHAVDYYTWGCRSDLTGSSSISVSWENCAFSILNASSQKRYGGSETKISAPYDFTVGNFSLPIPVSSRGIGFAVSYTYSSLTEYKDAISIYQLFRASLLQFQYRIFKSAEYKFKHLVIPKNYFKIFQALLDPRFVRPNTNNFKIIATVINCFGPFVEEGIEYHPCLPQTPIPNPFNVTIDNLRETVVALASTSEDGKSIRWNFYKHNSIPGALWKVDETNKNAFLVNPDEIIPNDYQPVDDLEALTRCMSFMETKDSDYVGVVKYLGQGSSCQLISIHEQCTDRIPSSVKITEKDSTSYQHFPSISKGIVAHARGNMSTQEMLLGILCLYGEHCKDTSDYEVWGCRSPSTGSCSAPTTLWKTLARYCAKLNMY